MGIGNPPLRTWPPPAPWRTHYPSWGSETYHAPKVRQFGPVDSLPLMGIGNPTPPGKPGRPSRPHYPSWGSETGDCSRAPDRPCRPHYPSWGSETPGPPTSGPRATHAHYPSWGSETAALPRYHGRRVAAHYPSWGSETRSEGAGQCAGFRKLITPHGDRKPGSGAPMSAAAVRSLPLMGIGNFSHAARNSRYSPPSHYPSWGSETGPRRPPGDGPAARSLPLMGIGNSPPSVTSTPAPSHSLPLMGIGNAVVNDVAAAGAVHSLPLMGIGNRR